MAGSCGEIERRYYGIEGNRSEYCGRDRESEGKNARERDSKEE